MDGVNDPYDIKKFEIVFFFGDSEALIAEDEAERLDDGVKNKS